MSLSYLLLFSMQLCYVLNTKSSVLSALKFLASDKKRAVSVLESIKNVPAVFLINWIVKKNNNSLFLGHFKTC